MIFKFLNRKKANALQRVLERIFIDKYKKNEYFNIYILREEMNDMQIVNSSYFYEFYNIDKPKDFGFLVLLSFSDLKIKYLSLFQKSKVFNLFNILEMNESSIWYYCDCELDIKKVLEIGAVLSTDVYIYTENTFYQIVEYTPETQ